MRALRKYFGLLAAVALLVVTVLAASAADTKVVAVREMDSLPTGWSPLKLESPEAEFIQDLTGGGMYQISHKDNFILSHLTTNLLEDVTAEYRGTYGIPENAVRGYAYRITLNDKACWDDGTPINADSWMYTLHKMLESGNESMLILANAAAYRNGETHDPQIISLAAAGYNSVAEAQEAGITDFYVDVEHYWGLGEGWRPVTDITRLKDPAMTQGYGEMYVSAAWLYNRYLADERPYAYFQREFVGIAGEGAPVTLNDVGMLKTGDYELVLILEEPEAETSLKMKLAEFRMVRAGSTYRSAEGSASYGPYRVAEVTAEGIRLEKNPNWWGKSGQYDEILCR